MDRWDVGETHCSVSSEFSFSGNPNAWDESYAIVLTENVGQKGTGRLLDPGFLVPVLFTDPRHQLFVSDTIQAELSSFTKTGT